MQQSPLKGITMTRRSTPTGLSLAIRKTMTSFSSGTNLIEKKTPSEFTIKIANTLEEREGVFKLAYQVYLEKGYIKENKDEWMVQNYDSVKETTILIVQDKLKNIVGSVTLVFDGTSKLPAEKIYDEELTVLRKQKERIAEISRLVIDPHYRNSKEILVLLFNYSYIYSYFVQNYTCFAIEVNPRHIAYYQMLLHFRTIGTEKPCPSVQSAPAILMYIPLKHGQDEVLRLSKNTVPEKNDRSLYHYFAKPEQQSLVAYYLQNQVKPISSEEKIYFGLTKSGA